MKNIVHIENNDLVVSIQDVADYSKTKYESVKRLLQNNSEEFKELGLRLPKEYDFKTLLLNEPQTSFLLTLMKNNPIVKRFKLELVKEFYKMREALCEVNIRQLEAVRQELKTAQVKKMKTYKDGFMSLRKYLKDNDIAMSEEKAWQVLIDNGVVDIQDILVARKILIDETAGRQDGDSVIEFNSKFLDGYFHDYIYRPPTLF